MATSKNTSSTLSDLSNKVNAIAAQLSGTEALLRMFNDDSDCPPAMGDALTLIAINARRMNDELSEIAHQMTKGAEA